MPWRHHCMECCGKSILRDFFTFLLKPHFDLEPDCIVRKPIKRRFQQYLVHTEILSTFHTRVKYISRRTIPPIQMSVTDTHTQTDRQKWKQYICQFHSVRLMDIKMTSLIVYRAVVLRYCSTDPEQILFGHTVVIGGLLLNFRYTFSLEWWSQDLRSRSRDYWKMPCCISICRIQSSLFARHSLSI